MRLNIPYSRKERRKSMNKMESVYTYLKEQRKGVPAGSLQRTTLMQLHTLAHGSRSVDEFLTFAKKAFESDAESDRVEALGPWLENILLTIQDQPDPTSEPLSDI